MRLMWASSSRVTVGRAVVWRRGWIANKERGIRSKGRR